MFRHFALLGLLALACVVSGFRVVLAADAVQTTVVDLGPLLNQVVIPFVIAVLGVLGAWVLMQLRARLGLQANSDAAAMLETAMQNGLALAQAELQRRSAGPVTVDMHSAIAASAANYVTSQAPAVLKQLGVTPDLLADKLKARIALNTTPADQSVAVPNDASVVRSIAMILMVGVLLVGAGGLTACTTSDTGGKVQMDAAHVNAVLDTVQKTYTAAVIGVTLYCAVQPDKAPCNSTQAMNVIATARAELDAVMVKVRADIALAQTADKVTVALQVALDAVATYTDTVRRLGVPKPAG